MRRPGRKSASQTRAPIKDRVKGSSVNKPKSAASKSSAKSIEFSDRTNQQIKNLVDKYNEKNPSKKISKTTANAVVRRGMGAYSSSHRPTISGGRPNNRNAWGLARLKAFMRKKSGSTTANGAVDGKRIKASYKQDNDLL
jgi:hypothetical protein